MKLIILGPPGSGKGTVAEKLVKDFHLKHIAPGDIFREEAAHETALGKKAKEYMKKGILVPNKITIPLIKNRLTDSFLLDGYPRDMEQAESLNDINLTAVIYLEVPEEVVVERLSNRRVCSKCGATFNLKFVPPKKEGTCDHCGGELIQRPDEKPEIIKQRFKTFHQQTQPLVNYYQKKGLLKKIDGSPSPAQVYQAIKKVVESLPP